VWRACHIPPGKLPVCFDDLQMHNSYRWASRTYPSHIAERGHFYRVLGGVRVEQRQTGSGRTFAAINSPATRLTREREGRAGLLFTPISNRCFPTPTSKKSLKPPRCCLIFACRLGMILKDAILSIVIALVAIIGAKGLGWAWYISWGFCGSANECGSSSLESS